MVPDKHTLQSHTKQMLKISFNSCLLWICSAFDRLFPPKYNEVKLQILVFWHEEKVYHVAGSSGVKVNVKLY